jgi:type I pantothenate kinase
VPGHSTYARSEWAQLGTVDLWPGGLEGRAWEDMPAIRDDITDVYLPLCSILVEMATRRRSTTSEHASQTVTVEGGPVPPFVIGVTGGVAAGKSASATVLKSLLQVAGTVTGLPRVDLLCTDNFLFPNAVLQDRGLLLTKGFPETYDIDRLLDAIVAIRSGKAEVRIPVYSHGAYDILGGESQVIDGPDFLIVEGLNVLQVAEPRSQRCLDIADLLDTSIYLDAAESDMAKWFSDRLLALRTSEPEDPSPFLRWFRSLTELEAQSVVTRTWSEVNLVNLRRHVAPTMERAEFVLRCDSLHHVTEVAVRTP